MDDCNIADPSIVCAKKAEPGVLIKGMQDWIYRDPQGEIQGMPSTVLSFSLLFIFYHRRTSHKRTCIYKNLEAEMSSFEPLKKEPQRG